MRTALLIVTTALLSTSIYASSAYAVSVTTSQVVSTAATSTKSAQSTGLTALQNEIVAGRTRLAHFKKELYPNPGIARTLTKGSLGKDVRLLQQFLGIYGTLSTSSVTGFFGRKTFEAVREFQRSESIDPIGIVGPKTRARIIVLSKEAIIPDEMRVSSSSPATTTVTSAIFSADVGEDGSGVGSSTVFSSSTKNIYAILTLTNAAQDTEIGFVRYFNGAYVDSGVTHPSRTGLRYVHFQWSLKEGEHRIPGTYTFAFYIDGKRVSTTAYSIH